MLELMEEQVCLSLELVRQEALAKSNLQADNLREQTLLSNLKDTQERMN